jgi:hypothetical protein
VHRRHLLASLALVACHRRRGASRIDGPFVPPLGRGLSRADFLRYMNESSEVGVAENADNYISNETSYLHLARLLEARRAETRAYLGVGPEQNFSYIALARPTHAFILDYRRGNLILHLLHKALFEHAQSRAHYLAMLLGRPFDHARDASSNGGIDAVLASALRLPASELAFVQAGARVRATLTETFGVALDEQDRFLRDETRAVFARRQLDGKPSGAHAPSLRTMLRATTREGARRSFLARESSFRYLQAMHKEHRIVPIVGDFAGNHAMASIAKLLGELRLKVGVFYLSNVEQYLSSDRWPRWLDNARALPLDDESTIVRSYLQDAREHPAHVVGHDTVSLAHSARPLLERRSNPPDYWELVTGPTLTGS